MKTHVHFSTSSLNLQPRQEQYHDLSVHSQSFLKQLAQAKPCDVQPNHYFMGFAIGKPTTGRCFGFLNLIYASHVQSRLSRSFVAIFFMICSENCLITNSTIYHCITVSQSITAQW